MTSGKRLLQATYQASERASVRSPYVKLAMIVIPYLLGLVVLVVRRQLADAAAQAQLVRWSAEELLLLVACLRMDARNLRRFVWHSTLYAAGALVILFTPLAWWEAGLAALTWNGSPIVLEALPYAFWLVAAMGIRLVSSRDAIWVGRRLFFKRWVGPYVALVCAYFFIQQVFGPRMRKVMMAGRTFWRLGKRHYWQRSYVAADASTGAAIGLALMGGVIWMYKSVRPEEVLLGNVSHTLLAAVIVVAIGAIVGWRAALYRRGKFVIQPMLLMLITELEQLIATAWSVMRERCAFSTLYNDPIGKARGVADYVVAVLLLKAILVYGTYGLWHMLSAVYG